MTELLTCLQTGEELYEQQFTALTLPKLEGKLLGSSSTFEQVSFAESSLVLDCTGGSFIGCDFSFCKLSDSSLSGVRFENAISPARISARVSSKTAPSPAASVT